MLGEGDAAAFMALAEGSREKPGKMDPEAYYYLAMWLEAKSQAAARAAAAPAGSAPAPEAAPPQAPPPENGKALEPKPESELPPALEGLGAPAAILPPLASKASADPRALALDFLRLAFERSSGYARREAGWALVERLAARAAEAAAGPAAKAAHEEVLAAADAFGQEFGPDWRIRRSRLEALDALGRDAELLRETLGLRSGFPLEAAADADALLYYEGAASRRLGKKAWAAPLRALLLERPASDWTAKALAFVESLEPEAAAAPAAASRGFQAAELHAARLRLEVRRRDYGAAYRAAARCLDLVLSPSTPRHLLADAGKAFLYSGSSKEGLVRFERAFGTAYPGAAATAAPAEAPAKAAGAEAGAARPAQQAGPADATAWMAAFYRARFMKALGRDAEAAALFKGLAPLAPGSEDLDAALWYGADAAMKAAKAEADAAGKTKSALKLSAAAREKAALKRAAGLRRLSLDVLAEASRSWRNPLSFADLADALFREAIAARDWELVADFASRLGPRLTPTLGARAAYAAGRALELGLGSGDVPEGPPRAERAEAFFRAVLARSDASPYYRILAARRLGEDGSRLPPAQAAPPGREPGEAEAFLGRFFDFGLPELVYAEAKARSAELDREALRRLSARLAKAGLHADSMRLALLLSERPDWDPRRSDFELIYPRPFLEEYRSIRPRPDVPEHVLYGLIRSESFFRPEIVSRAGAIGLSQLMPATAEETARALRLASYDLTKPEDNLRIGAAHFAELLAQTGDHPLRAMFAYNAGRGRLKRWLAESSDLPDDLLLEALTIEETRQYGRNILQAATIYGELYYGMDPAAAVDGMLGEAASRR